MVAMAAAPDEVEPWQDERARLGVPGTTCLMSRGGGVLLDVQSSPVEGRGVEVIYFFLFFIIGAYLTI